MRFQLPVPNVLRSLQQPEESHSRKESHHIRETLAECIRRRYANKPKQSNVFKTGFVGISRPRVLGATGVPLPSPRVVSTVIHPDISNLHTRYTLMTMQFAQFLDHDLTMTPIHKGKTPRCVRSLVLSSHPQVFTSRFLTAAPAIARERCTRSATPSRFHPVTIITRKSTSPQGRGFASRS